MSSDDEVDNDAPARSQDELLKFAHEVDRMAAAVEEDGAKVNRDLDLADIHTIPNTPEDTL